MAEEEQIQKTITTPAFTIWPPSKRTRDAVINKLIETLSSSSVLSKRYGVMSPEEAASAARVIEEEAFLVSSSSSKTPNNDDGIETLQFYSKEISKRMLDAVKSRASDHSEPISASEETPPPLVESESSEI